MRTPILLALATLAAGCSTVPSMKLAPELVAIPAQPVTGRNAVLGYGELAFGRWRSSAPARIPNDRWWRAGGMVATGLNEETGVRTDRAALGFDVSSEGAPGTQSRCIVRGKFIKRTRYSDPVTDETAIAVPGFPRIDCEFAGAQTGQMSLRPEYVTQRDSGIAEFGEQHFGVRSVNNLAGQRSGIPLARFGYEFTLGDRVVGAVETAGTGRVWIDPALSAREQDELAVASTALLYYASLLEYEDDGIAR